MRRILTIVAALILAMVSSDRAQASDAHAATKGTPPDQAIKLLRDGNARFVARTPVRPHQDEARRCETFAGGQHPFAAVLACADSRVPVEIIFDAGIGDLFTIRVAGNVADVDEIGTIEYGVEHLGINTIVVMGHTKCGAVTAVVDHAHVTPNIAKLVDNIAPAAEAAHKAFPNLTGAPLVAKATEANVRQAMSDLQSHSELIRKRVESHAVKILGGVYDLHSGEVIWLDSDASATPVTDSTKPATPDASHDHKPAAESHGKTATTSEPHSSAASHKEEPMRKSAPKENFLALGSLLGGAGVASWGLIHFRQSQPRN